MYKIAYFAVRTSDKEGINLVSKYTLSSFPADYEFVTILKLQLPSRWRACIKLLGIRRIK